MKVRNYRLFYYYNDRILEQYIFFTITVIFPSSLDLSVVSGPARRVFWAMEIGQMYSLNQPREIIIEILKKSNYYNWKKYINLR